LTVVSRPAADPPRKLLRDGVRSLVETRGRVLMWPFDALLRISAIVDAGFGVIADGVSA
jgi:hypothetical protein